MLDNPTTSTPSSPNGTWDILRWYAENPLWGLIGTIASVIGVILAIWLFFAATKSRDLTFYVNGTKSTIVKAGQSSDLHVLYKGLPITSDVTAIQIGLWNAGKESIKRENILDTVRIQLLPPVPILEAKLGYLTRPVIGISLSADKAAQGVVGIDWKILEESDGAVIQLIIAGPASAKIDLSRTIEGQTAIRRLTVLGDSSKEIVSILFGVIITITLIVTVVKILSSWKREKERFKIALVLILSMAAICSVIPVIQSWKDIRSSTPLYFDRASKSPPIDPRP